MSRVLAVTTSMGTKWESYSQALLALHVPEWSRLIVDGRKNWTSIGFLQHVLDSNADYVVHVDEDCFVRSREGLLALLSEFERDEGLVAAGIPDGGHFYREQNPAALNLFFVVFRMSALRQALTAKEQWGTLRFEPRFAAELFRQIPDIDRSRIQWQEAEPYYPLFWSLLSVGGRFLYLGNRLNRVRWSTNVLSPAGVVVAEHLWYLRQWFSQSVMPGHDCANRVRFCSFEKELRNTHMGARFHALLARAHTRRLLRRAFT